MKISYNEIKPIKRSLIGDWEVGAGAKWGGTHTFWGQNIDRTQSISTKLKTYK